MSTMYMSTIYMSTIYMSTIYMSTMCMSMGHLCSGKNSKNPTDSIPLLQCTGFIQFS
ncbi:hypothetical protein VSP9026_00047 [Vibrio spartinae]|uniref:Uncharacterized protein n=1 Tax=Vibrio spartinae TaxID=1918945 RepID=A0A1N6LZ26_9VIBR|nr:hypothetical protein VSP9026_00047 [Vibrio spartinae]